MAKMKQSWLSGATGKAGGKVFYRSVNGTVMRDLVIPKNPQTQLQMAQRIIFATVTQAAKFMRPIINHSFEGVAVGQKSVNKFVSENIARLRALAANDFTNVPTAADALMFTTTKGISQLIPNSYLVADGSLAQPKVKVVKQANGLSIEAPALALTLTANDAGFYGVTVADVLKNIFGIASVSDQLSLIAIARTQDEYMYSFEGDNAPGFQIASTGSNTRRVVFASTVDLGAFVALVGEDGELLESATNSIIDAFAVAVDASKSDAQLVSWLSELIRQYTLTVVGSAAAGYRVTAEAIRDNIDGLYIYDAAEASGHAYAAGIIRSQYVDGKWRRSRTYLTLAAPTSEQNFGLLWAVTLEAWFRGDTIAENSNSFLDEGGVANEIGVDF